MMQAIRLALCALLASILCSGSGAAERFDSCHGERILAEAPRLLPCAGKPNCVSTEAVDPDRKMAPIPVSGDETSTREKLLAAIAAQHGSHIEIADGGFVVATFRSRLFGFVDEAQFLIETAEHRIRFRSGACSGYYDFGVNRSRIESIRATLLK